MIEANNITKEYKMGTSTVHALRGVSLKIKKGDFVIIVGPSGSGKSTLMHILGALDHPTSGTVHIGGRNITELDDWHLAMIRREKIGFIFQAFNLIPTLNALENVMIPTEPMNLPPEQVAEKAKALLRQMGLQDRMFHKPSELSGGERQRVSIARALINNPDLIFADEPTGNLDSITGGKIVSEMRRLNKEEQKTFVIVTHDESLLRFASVQYHMRDGKMEGMKSNRTRT